MARAEQPFRRPADYPAESVAISGTHDTDTLAEWWDGADRRERHLFAEIPGLREAGCDPDAPFDARLVMRCSTRCSVPDRTSSSSRSRICSAGGIVSTCRQS